MRILPHISSLLAWLQGPNDRIVIDQDAARREAERRLRADKDFRRAVAVEQKRTGMQIGAWAQQSVAARRKAPFPDRMRRQYPLWLQGLSGQEITNLSKASREEIRRHVFAGELIPGVRRMQPLDAQDPVFPLPVLPAEILNDREGGGGKRMKKSSGFAELGGSSWQRI
jgi:hypothetical protein